MTEETERAFDRIILQRAKELTAYIVRPLSEHSWDCTLQVRGLVVTTGTGTSAAEALRNCQISQADMEVSGRAGVLSWEETLTEPPLSSLIKGGRAF